MSGRKGVGRVRAACACKRVLCPCKIGDDQKGAETEETSSEESKSSMKLECVEVGFLLVAFERAFSGRGADCKEASRTGRTSRVEQRPELMLDLRFRLQKGAQIF